jgi:chemotaxis signal transduction protein
VETQTARAPSQRGQYLLFRVARQDFAMDASRVRGIMPAQELVPIDPPHSWICGFASLLGRDFPVVDLRGKLGITRGSHGRLPCVVVAEIASRNGTRLLGFVADRVSDIVNLRDRDFHNGTVRTGGRSRRVLDPNYILSEEELMGLWKLIP